MTEKYFNFSEDEHTGILRSLPQGWAKGLQSDLKYVELTRFRLLITSIVDH